jgi:hypothetical protein
MKKCKCGHDTFVEYSKEDCKQRGIQVDDDGNYNYENASTIEILGTGQTDQELCCEFCSAVFPESTAKEKQYVIYSRSEDAYWDNELGWLDEVDVERNESMIFSETDKNNFILPTPDGQWTELI